MRKSTAFETDTPDKDDSDQGEEKDEDDIADIQAGHTSHIAGMIYARGVMEQAGVVQTKQQRFRKSSIDWHRFLGFGSAIGVFMEKDRGETRSAPFQDEASKAFQQRMRQLQNLQLQPALQQMLGPTVEFQGAQKETLEAIVQGKSPVISVMATGSGKSLLFMLPAWAQPGGTSVVVVPLIALRSDMLNRCRRLGIHTMEWNARQPPDGATVVLVTPESALSPDFMTFINRLRLLHQLD